MSACQLLFHLSVPPQFLGTTRVCSLISQTHSTFVMPSLWNCKLRVVKTLLSVLAFCNQQVRTQTSAATFVFRFLCRRPKVRSVIALNYISCEAQPMRNVYLSRPSVCLSVPRRIPISHTTAHGPGCNLGEWQGVPSIVVHWTDLQSVQGFRWYDSIAANAKRQRVLVLALCLLLFFVFLKSSCAFYALMFPIRRSSGLCISVEIDCVRCHRNWQNFSSFTRQRNITRKAWWKLL